MTDKIKLVSMVKAGGKRAEVKKAHSDKEKTLLRHLKYEEDLLAVKAETLEAVSNTAGNYSYLIISARSAIKANRSEMEVLLKQAKANATALRNTASKKEVIKLAMLIGSNRTQVELLKVQNHTHIAEIQNFENLRRSTEREEDKLTADIENIKKSIQMKKKALGIDNED